jgi:hypothetical protein
MSRAQSATSAERIGPRTGWFTRLTDGHVRLVRGHRPRSPHPMKITFPMFFFAWFLQLPRPLLCYASKDR